MRFALFLIATHCMTNVAMAVEMPSGYFHGTLDAIEVAHLEAHTKSGEMFRCGFDARTYIEMDAQRITPARLEKNDPVEILADRRAGSPACYVRTLRVITNRPLAKRSTKVSNWDDLMPKRGDREISGTVVRREGSILVLRTRDGREAIYLRPDTKYLAAGIKQDAAALSVNQRVSVRASVSRTGEMEANQIVWGEITEPSGKQR